MPTIFYQIFNNQLKITESILKQLKNEIKILFTELKNRNDIDNINVLKNKLSHLLDEKEKKKIKKQKKNIIILEIF